MSVAWRRARADLWPLVVTALVVALAVGLSVAVPRLLAVRADAAVRSAAALADPPADLVVTAGYGAGTSSPRADAAETRASVDDAAALMQAALPATLRPLFGAPVVDATSTDLGLSTPGLPTGGVLWMSYLWAGHEPAVRWIAGGAPGRPGPDGAVQLGLSEAVARVLGVGAGDTFRAIKADKSAVPVLVSGVFTASDPRDPAWTARPEVLRPRLVGPSDAPTTVVGGLLSADSLPPARVALEPDGVTRTFRFPVVAQAMSYGTSGAVLRKVAALEGAPEQLHAPGPAPRVTSELDQVLTQARQRVAATWSQAMIVLAGLACGAMLVLLVAADLLARRRSAALRTVRARGVPLVAVAGGWVAESAVVVAVGACVGLGLGALAPPGPVTWPWVVAVAAVGILAPPAFALVTAARGEARRVPTDRHRRRMQQRVRTVRRLSVEAAVLVLALAAFTALRRRGALSLAGVGDLLLAAAPALVAAAAGLVLWRVVPPLLGGALGVARRSRKAGPLLAVSRARSTGAVLSFTALVVVTALVALCGALAGTARAGQAEGAWDSVGADVLVRTPLPDASLPGVADELARSAGVEAVAVGRVQESGELYGVPGFGVVRVLAVDPVSYDRLLARTPFGSSPALASLAAASRAATSRTTPGPVPALVPAALLGAHASLSWGPVTVDLQPVGRVPALPTQGPDGSPAGATVVVDRAALAAVVTAVTAARAAQTDSAPADTSHAADPDTVWAVGPGAVAAARAADPPAGSSVVSRVQWLADRRADPLSGGLLALALLVAVGCAALAAVVVVLDAAASAPGRSRALATARVLGLRGSGASRVSVGELMPPALVAAAAGAVVGIALVGALVAPLALRLVTGQSGDPGVVLSWWAVVPVAVLVVTVLVVVAIEQSARRRERLGQVLRVR